ncbi:hypothetical protein SKAU_G00262100 [Synaphobranchus kaupii]|uniref:Uncharacterized protein n=1 Tax=Synaphobranchus kaupii TaxID=118154 RepID=A0A9Q1EYV7_SYNKA|nr:hypothetical protein SKAU_G00262100 [Synaphobranchus kaupii]
MPRLRGKEGQELVFGDTRRASPAVGVRRGPWEGQEKTSVVPWLTQSRKESGGWAGHLLNPISPDRGALGSMGDALFTSAHSISSYALPAGDIISLPRPFSSFSAVWKKNNSTSNGLSYIREASLTMKKTVGDLLQIA